MALFKARHRRRARFGLRSGLRFIGFVSTLILLAALALQWLVPREWVQWQAEQHLGARLGLSVALPGAALGMFPLPHVRADALDVAGPEGTWLRAAGARLFIDPGGLLRGLPFQRVELERLTLGPGALAALIAGPGTNGDVGLRRLRAERIGAGDPADLDAKAPALHLDRLPGERWLARLERAGQTLSVQAEQAGRWLRTEWHSAAWTLADAPAIVLQDLSGVARLLAERIELEPFSARIGGGVLRASLDLRRTEGWRLQGSLSLEKLPLQPLLTRLDNPLLQGRADGTLYLSGHAAQLRQLLTAPAIDGELDLHDGALSGIDLARAARQRGMGQFSGGVTPFDALHVALQIGTEGQRLDLRGLQSPALRAGGDLRLQGGQLGGDIQVRLSASGADVALLVSGTPGAPLLRIDPDTLHRDDWREPPPDTESTPQDDEEDWPWILRGDQW